MLNTFQHFLAFVPAVVLGRPRGCGALAIVANHPGERPKLFLLCRGHPALDDDVIGVL